MLIVEMGQWAEHLQRRLQEEDREEEEEDEDMPECVEDPMLRNSDDKHIFNNGTVSAYMLMRATW